MLSTIPAPAAVNGFASEGPTVSSRGTYNAKTESVLRREISDFEALPSARAAAFTLVEMLQKEQRQTLVCKPKDIKIGDDAAITLADEQIMFSKQAFQGLCRQLGWSGAAGYLSAVSPELRAYNLRALLRGSSLDALQIRVRVAPSGERSVYAVVGQDYPAADGITVLQHIASHAPTDAKADWRYSYANTRIEFKELLRQEINPKNYVFNKDVFQIGRAWNIVDTGAAAIRAALLTFRRQCANMILVQSNEDFIMRAVHRGDLDAMQRKLVNVTSSLGDASAKFISAWDSARDIRVLPDATMDYAVKMYERLAADKYLPVTKADAPLVVAGLAMAWSDEHGVSVADIVNGITRYARDLSVKGSRPFVVEEFESAAGDLLTLPARQWTRMALAH
ncbi:MAG: hypothetical protein ACO32I_04945 [Candidatus Limnocylindrus sp.]